MAMARSGTTNATAPFAAGPPRESSADRAYREMKRRILGNEMLPGTQVLEGELAASLGLSRTPVREAMIRLAEDGLVEVRPRHGMRVLPISATDMAEIYLILTELEAAAARIVADKGVGRADLAALEGAVRDMDVALKADDLDAWAAADERFHKMLVELSGNRRIVAVVNMFWDQAHRARMATLRIRPKPVNSNKDHAAVVAAIRRRDADAAYTLHRQHRVRATQMLAELIERLRLKAL